MPLLEAGRVIEDRWTEIDAEAPVPADRPAIVPLARLRAEEAAFAGRNAPLGVRVTSDTSAATLADLVGRVEVIAIEFPKFNDGRGFTIARHLREHLGYKGEIRAVGHVLPDQYDFLTRTGFTTVAASDARLNAFLAARGRMDVAYQKGYGEGAGLSLMRRRALG
jgi:uncharacterized protein (DUF934 family)